MVFDMERDLNNILTEVLLFPYEQSIVTALEGACSDYANEIELGQYENCVMHLCMDIPAADLIQYINKKTERKFPNRVYRALAGYVVGEALSIVTDEDDKVMFPLALRNVLKVKTDDVNGIISKSINPSCLSEVEAYWASHNVIPSLSGKEIVSSVFDLSTWAETGLEIEDAFEDIKALAKFYCREQFEKKYADLSASDDQDVYKFAFQVADDLASQNWLFAPINPVQTLKKLNLRGSAIALSTIKSRIKEDEDVLLNDVETTSVYRRYFFANDYDELGSRRISPQNFAIAIFYENLYEHLKSENYGK